MDSNKKSSFQEFMDFMTPFIVVLVIMYLIFLLKDFEFGSFIDFLTDDYFNTIGYVLLMPLASMIKLGLYNSDGYTTKYIFICIMSAWLGFIILFINNKLWQIFW